MNQTRGSKRSSSPKKNNDISKKRMLDEKENVDTNLQNVSQPRPALQPIQPHSESTVPHIQILRCEESSLNDYHDMFPSPEQQEALSPPLSPSPSSSTPHLLLPEEQQEHLSYFFQNERRFMPTSGDYINEIQREISPNMRAILIGWIIEVCIDMNLSTDTIFHCKNYIDRYLSICHVPRCFLQLLGITCLFVASKLEDITPPTINDLVQVSDEIYQRIQIIELETKLLNVLDFSLVSINEKNFLRRYHLIELPFVRSKEKAERVRFLSNYLLELSLLEYSIIIYPPSIIAAAVFSLSLATFGFSPWSTRLQQYTPYTSETADIQTVVAKILKISQFTTPHCPIYKKYNTKKHLFISSYRIIPQGFSEDLELL